MYPLLSLAKTLPFGATHAFPRLLSGQATTFGTVLNKPTLRATTRSMAGGFANGPRLRVLGFSHLIYFASPRRLSVSLPQQAGLCQPAFFLLNNFTPSGVQQSLSHPTFSRVVNSLYKEFGQIQQKCSSSLSFLSRPPWPLLPPPGARLPLTRSAIPASLWLVSTTVATTMFTFGPFTRATVAPRTRWSP